MGIIHLVTEDFFQIESCIDYYVNPVNLHGISGAGLALEFRKRCPDHIEPYRTACRTKELRIGTVTTYDNKGQRWGIINLPTKRDPYELSTKEDIVRGLQAIRELLKTDKFRYATIGMPMLGCGCGKQSYDIVYPLIIEYLQDLDATVFLSMHPEKTEIRPKYLGMFGPRSFGDSDLDKAIIENTLNTCMKHWGNDISDYSNVVVISEGDNRSTLAIQETVKRLTGIGAIKVIPNHVRHPSGPLREAMMTLTMACEDLILFKPKDHDVSDVSRFQLLIESVNQTLEEKKRVAYFGIKSTDFKVKSNILTQNTNYGKEV